MTPFDYQTHIPVKGGEEHEVRLNPYIQITGENGSFLLRGGKFWSADGVEIDEDDIPQWVLNEVDRMTPAGRASVGFQTAAPAAKAVAPAKPAAKASP